MPSGPAQLADWMKRRSFNQTEAAEYLGIHKVEVSYYLSSTRTPGLETALQIERRSGIPVEAWSTSVDESREAAPQPAANRSNNKSLR